MASGWYDRAVADVLSGTLTSGAPLKAMLVDDSYSFDPTEEFIADLSAFEIVATNYAGGFGGAGRKALTVVTFVAGAAFRINFTIDATISWLSIGGAVNDRVKYMIVVREVTTDANSILVTCIELPGSGYLTKGVTMTLTFPSPVGYVQRGA